MAWSKWELRLEGEILWLGFNNNRLNIITLTNGVTEKRRVDMSTRTPDAPDSIHLDDMVKVTIPLGTDTGTLPDNFPDHQDLVYVQTSDCKSPYYTATATRVGNTITVSTNVHKDTDATLYVGRPYTSEFTPTRQFTKGLAISGVVDQYSILNGQYDTVSWVPSWENIGYIPDRYKSNTAYLSVDCEIFDTDFDGVRDSEDNCINDPTETISKPQFT